MSAKCCDEKTKKTLIQTGLSGVNVFSKQELLTLVKLVRKGVFEMCLDSNHGHIGGCSGAVELFVSLYFGGILRFNPFDPKDDRRDRVLVRGHLGPLRYKIYSMFNWVGENELDTYCKFGSRLLGHEDYLQTPGVDMGPTGSLGMLLSYGVGSALGARDAKNGYRTFVFLGDGEEQEGNVSEAARHAAHLKLGNLIAVIDKNGKQLSNPVSDVDCSDLAKIWEGYGWRVILLSRGNNVNAVLSAYKKALALSAIKGQPTVIIAETTKGIGLEGAKQHFSGFHTINKVKRDVVLRGIEVIQRSLDDFLVQKTLDKLVLVRNSGAQGKRNKQWQPMAFNLPLGEQVPNDPHLCQNDYCKEMLKAIDSGSISTENFYYLTADVTIKEAVDSYGIGTMFQFHNVGIREQHLIALAHGLSIARPESRIFINCLDAFTYRCFDQLQASCQGHGNMIIVGAVAGITNSLNGKTHQTIGLPGALLSIGEGFTFLEPWDAQDTFNCLNWAFGQSRGIVYIRTHSSAVKQRPDRNAVRSLGYYVVHEPNGLPDIVLVGSGLTVDSCLEVSKKLEEEGTKVRVINVVNPNFLDEHFVVLIEDRKPLLTVYNGNPRILRQVVADALLSFHSGRPSIFEGLGVSVGTTGTFYELLEWTGIGANGVLKTAKRLLEGKM